MEENDGRKTKEYFDNLPIKRIPQPPKPKDAITIAVSLRTLFNMTKDRQVYEDQGQEKYVQYQLEHEKQPFLPGVAFPLVKALMNVNSVLRELFPESKELFDIVLMTKKPTQAGVRLVNSIYHYGLPIERIGLSGSESFMGYLKAYKTDLYLSSDSQKVKEAIREGIAAATMFSCDCDNDLSDTQLRIAFDGDGVLFSDELEIIMRTQGLDTVFEHEKRFENKPLAQGPLKGFLEALGRIQKKIYVKDQRLRCPIRTYLVTARSAASSGARVLKTLRSWGLKVDEALFLAGAPKGPVLQEIKPHIFFDDQVFHIEGAQKLGVITAHVPYGIGQKNI